MLYKGVNNAAHPPDTNTNSIKSVTYWPSTESSIKRCTYVNKRKNSVSRWTLNKNITRTQTAWVSWTQDAELRAIGRLRALGSQWPTVEQPSQDEKEVLLWSEELGSICSSLSPYPAHHSHTANINPFENKVWEIYFYKEACSFVRHYCWLCFHIYLHMYCVYNKRKVW